MPAAASSSDCRHQCRSVGSWSSPSCSRLLDDLASRLVHIRPDPSSGPPLEYGLSGLVRTAPRRRQGHVGDPPRTNSADHVRDGIDVIAVTKRLIDDVENRRLRGVDERSRQSRCHVTHVDGEMKFDPSPATTISPALSRSTSALSAVRRRRTRRHGVSSRLAAHLRSRGPSSPSHYRLADAARSDEPSNGVVSSSQASPPLR